MNHSKIMRLLFSFCICAMILLASPACCFAMNTGFDVSDKTENDAVAIISRLDLNLIEEPEINKGFSCFDINENGDYALGFDCSNDDIVLVYNCDGEYLYGFSFFNNGDLGLEWDDDKLILYLVRGDLAILLDDSGNCWDIKKIENNLHNHDYWRNEVDANKRNINGAVYTAEHWLFNSELLHWGAYPRLVKSTPDGVRTILFDNTAYLISRILSIIVLDGIVILLAIVIPVIQRIKKRHNSNRT